MFTVYLVSPTVAMSKMLPTVPDLSGSQPENTAGCDAAPSRARTRVCLPSLSRNTWELGDWTAAMTLATKATPDHIIAAFLLRQHANRLEPSRTRTTRAPGTRVTGTAFEEAHSTTAVGPMREQAALWGWVMIDSLLDYSEALVMNLLHVLVLFWAVWTRSVSECHWFRCVLVPNVQIIQKVWESTGTCKCWSATQLRRGLRTIWDRLKQSTRRFFMDDCNCPQAGTNLSTHETTAPTSEISVFRSGLWTKCSKQPKQTWFRCAE